MDFEFDPSKSASNKDKHGLDFEEAKALWLDYKLIELPSRYENEPRRLAIGMIAGKLWSAILTMRDDRIRLISVRRARRSEEQLYEDQ